MHTLSIVSINIERSNHLEKVTRFLEQHTPEVLCLQELCERDIPYFESLLGTSCTFAPMGTHPSDEDPKKGVVVGVGILSTAPLVSSNVYYYSGSEGSVRTYPMNKTFSNHPLVICDLQKADELFRIMTTHFTWTPDGSASDLQRNTMKNMLMFLDTQQNFVLTGDFNAPRGGEIFSMLAEKYADNIPIHYKTSIDIALHRNGRVRPHELIDKMVDGLFTTSAYSCSNVTLHSDVSDHMVVRGSISQV